MWTSCLTLLLLLQAAPMKYPRPELLVEPMALLKPHPFVLLDTRAKADYQAGHIPGALSVSANDWSASVRAMPDSAWLKKLGELGIDQKTPVVVYSDDLREAARMWWILRFWGIEDVRLLHGGWQGWKEVNGPISQEEGKPTPKAVQHLPETQRLATKEQLLSQLKNQPPQIIDARTAGEHYGKTFSAKRPGTIPAAVHLEWSELVDAQTQRFKSAAALQELFARKGIQLNEPTVTFCQSGARASVMVFGLELMGAKQVRNYYASWAEWGNQTDTPVVKPQPPKKP